LVDANVPATVPVPAVDGFALSFTVVAVVCFVVVPTVLCGLGDEDGFRDAVTEPLALAIGLAGPLPPVVLDAGRAAAPDMVGSAGRVVVTRFGVLKLSTSTNTIAAAAARAADAPTARHSQPGFPRPPRFGVGAEADPAREG